MGALTDALFLAGGLAFWTALGWPLCVMMPAEVNGRFWAAPVLGLSLFCVIATVGYRSGLPLRYAPLVGILCAAAAYGVPRLRTSCLPRIEPRAAAVAACALAAACLLVLSPKWIGGFQFAAFQGNHYDQANYISNASAFAQLGYADFAHLSETNKLANTFNFFAAYQLGARPTVGFVLAALRTPFYDTTFEAAYPYLSLLQILTFFAAVFVLRAAFRAKPWPALALGLVLATGTYLQLIFDMNAWSQLAATPQALVLVALAALLLAGTPKRWLAVPLGVSAAGICYVYPEITLVAATASAGVALGGCLGRPWREWFGGIKAIAFAGAASLLVCVPYWHGTIGFLLHQARAVGQKAYPADWFLYYYRYLFGRNEHVVDIILNPGGLAQRASLSTLLLPVDFALGALGLHFLSPEPGPRRTLWLLMALAAVAGLVVSIVVAVRSLRAASPAGFAFVCGVLLALAVPAAAFASGRLWPGGKGMLMVAPLLYFALIAPLLVPVRPRWRVLPLLLVCAHFAFAVERPIAALRPNGIHRQFPPYPTIMEKAAHDWDLPRHKSRLRACRAVALDLAHPLLDRVVQTFTADLGLRWYSQRPLRSYYEQGSDLGRQAAIPEADCVITDDARAADDAQRLHRINLRRGP